MRKKILIILASLLVFMPANAKSVDWALPESYVQYAPFAMDLLLPVCGVPSRISFEDRAIQATVSFALDIAIVQIIKGLVSEERPDGSNFNSFPSGHTSIAFTGAELVRMDYGNAWGVASYLSAAYVGAARVQHKRHYWHDAAVGAALGVLSAHLGRAITPYVRTWVVDPVFDFLGLDSQTTSLTPAVDPLSGTAMARFCITF